MKRILTVLFLSLLLCASAYADTITLKSGKKVDGKIVEKSADWVKVDSDGVKLTYFLDEVGDINGEKIVSAAKEVVGPQQQVVKPEPQKPQVPFQAEIITQEKTAVGKLELPQIDTSLALTFLALLLVFGYIYPSLCLQFIAAKTNHRPVWLAWVPVGNLFLMCRVARISYLWLLMLFLTFIPILGLVVNFVLGGYIWFKIAQARNKPGWVGALAVVPIAGLAIFAYLAFSE